MITMRSKGSEERVFTLKNILVALVVVIFFAGIIFFYYRMLYIEKQNNIIKNGEMITLKSADRFEKYLSTNIDSIKLTAYYLDEMITDGRTDDDIQDFLVRQSTAIKSAVIENSTGLYGYINDRFFSGTNWQPPDDYVATERPWYTNPMADKGAITILEPYVDVQSGNTMLAIGKTLCDGVSVVSVDVSLEQVQKLTEDAVLSGDSDIEMILNDEGVVVAHSDYNEVGKEYGIVDDTLGPGVFDRISKLDGNSFEFDHDGLHYIVYVAGIQNGWYCVSLKNATSVFSSLNMMLATTIVVVILVVLIICIILNKSNKREIIANHLSRSLSSAADIYISMHEIDFLNDCYSEIRNSKSEVSELTGKSGNNCKEQIRMIMERFSDVLTKEGIVDFVDFSKLDERLKEHNTITHEFLSKDGLWCKARFIVSRRLADGRVSRALFLIENIDVEKRNREKLTEVAETLGFRISSIANIYMTVHELDVATGTFIAIKSDSRIVSDLVGENRVHAQAMINKVMENVCDESCLDDVIRFVDLSTLERRLSNTDTIAIEYMNKKKLWRRGRFIVSRRDEEGKLLRILWLAEDIDAEKKERDKLIDMSERAIAANEAKTSFLSNISHEIRTPINVMLGMNEMVLRECDDDNIIAYSENIRRAGNSLLALVNDILDFSKIEEGKFDIVPVDYDMSSVINDLVNMVQEKADEKGLALALDFDRDMPKLLHGDELRIKQVITNLFNNAVQYTERGCITFGIRYEKIPERTDRIVLNIYIKYTGTGIIPEYMNNALSESGKAAEEEQITGMEETGFGFNITHKLIELMGSSLKVDSLDGVGTKVYFDLEQEVVKWEPLGDYEKAYIAAIKGRSEYKEKFTAPDASILVVDDIPMNLIVFKSLLKQTQIRIDTAESGDEGLSLASDKKYDLIFFDHMMPEKDGIQTLHELRGDSNNPNIDTAVICLTANAVSGARENYIAEGFDDYLTKPIDSAKLEDMLSEYLPKDKILPTGVDDTLTPEKVLQNIVKNSDEIDIDTGLKNNGDVTMYIKSLKAYPGLAENYADQIREYMEDGDITNIIYMIRALKYISMIIGAVDIGDIARETERSCKEDNNAFGRYEIENLLERCCKLGKHLSSVMN